MKQVSKQIFESVKSVISESGEVTFVEYGELTEWFGCVGMFGFQLGNEFFTAYSDLVNKTESLTS